MVILIITFIPGYDPLLCAPSPENSITYFLKLTEKSFADKLDSMSIGKMKISINDSLPYEVENNIVRASVLLKYISRTGNVSFFFLLRSQMIKKNLDFL